MPELAATYEQIARPWTHDQLAKHYREANRRGERNLERDHNDALTGPIPFLASSIPRSASLSVAIHVLHVLPSTTGDKLAQELVGTIDENATAVLRLCHRALELDGQAHDYTADEWLPTWPDPLRSVRSV